MHENTSYRTSQASATFGGEDVFLYEPLALEYIAAGIAEDHDVRIFDMRLDEDLASQLENFKPDIVGFTAYTVHVNVVRRLAREVKARFVDILTVVGGHHASVSPVDFSVQGVDLVVMGEGIQPFRDILKRREAGKSFEHIPGVAVNSGNGLLMHDAPAEMNLDDAPFPARGLTRSYRPHYYLAVPIYQRQSAQGKTFARNPWSQSAGSLI